MRWMALLTVLVATACMAPPAVRSTSTTAPHWIDWGVFLDDQYSQSSDMSVVTQMAGSSPHYVLQFAAIDEKPPIPELNAITATGATPIMTLEPWQPGNGTEQPNYALRRVAGGAFDPQLDTWAGALAAWGRPVILRFGHEMNSDHYPWSIGVNGTSAADFVAAWKHVRERFKSAGASQVSFMWCPDAPHAGSTDMSAAFPGVDAVDMLGLDGYNWGEGDGHSWRSAEDVFAAGLDQLRSLDDRHPILISETASAEGPQSGSDKASWIYGLFDFLARQKQVTGLVWFQAVKERDWRFNSSGQAQDAFRQAVARRTGG